MARLIYSFLMTRLIYRPVGSQDIQYQVIMSSIIKGLLCNLSPKQQKISLPSISWLISFTGFFFFFGSNRIAIAF